MPLSYALMTEHLLGDNIDYHYHANLIINLFSKGFADQKFSMVFSTNQHNYVIRIGALAKYYHSISIR
jgi:hypothetical protein